MAHNIYIDATGSASMAYSGEVPWHDLGQAMHEGATIEDWVKAAGFDYEINRSAVTFDFNGQTVVVPNRFALHRSDTGYPLSIVSDRFKVVQPAEIMDFFRDLCNQSDWTLETAGILNEGAKYWGLARTKLDMSIQTSKGKSDQHNLYMLLATSCDGTMATVAQPTDIRVVCNNTLSIATEKTSGERISIKHSSTFDAKDVLRKLAPVDFERSFEDYQEQMQKLADTPVSTKQAETFFAELLRPGSTKQQSKAKTTAAATAAAAKQNLSASSFEDLLQGVANIGEHTSRNDKAPLDMPNILPAATNSDGNERAIRGLETLKESYYNAPGASVGNAYGLINGVTHYLDHARGSNANSRMSSAWFGQGASVKQRALEMANELANV